MRGGRDIHIDAPVSKSLLDNLEEFQWAFSMWLPQLKAVDIFAQSEVTSAPTSPADDAICTFSGGVDASFTAYRHIFKKPGKRHRNLKTAMLVHGFDIPVGNEEAFSKAVASAEKILEGTGVTIATVKTNLKPLLGFSWEQTFVAALAACLHQFSAGHRVALIGSGEPYRDVIYPWGSNPTTNPLLGSDYMQMLTDGQGFTRTQKVGHVAQWPAARDNIRVCWEGPITGRNCGKCEKCIRTLLNFKAVRAPLSKAFASDVTDEQIGRLRVRSKLQMTYLEDVHQIAKANGITESWVAELKELIDRGPST